MVSVKKLDVCIAGVKVGTLAVTDNYLCAFEYSDEWLMNGYSISPFSLPLEKKVFIPKSYTPFDGLFGIFADSLPDGWGRLLVDRLLMKNKINPYEVDSINRLAIVGKSGMGALEYYPENIFLQKEEQMSLDEIAKECERIFETNNSESLDTIFQMGGSSGGARPKVYYDIDGEEWIVKFPSSYDSKDIGQQEYEYSLCAGRCGINMPETRLLNSSIGSGYFAVKRFDRQGDKKIHMVSVSGLLETSHRIPNLDYNQLMKLTFILTKSYEEVEKMYRLMCFNVFAHNRDDHSKNFFFIYNDNEKVWELSPAYDLTYSNSIGGEHATMVDGNGRNPGMKEILQVAENIQLDSRRAKKIAENIYEIVANDLKDYINQSYK